MGSRSLAAWVLLLCFSVPLRAAEVSGVKVEDKDKLANTELTLNGAGLRKRFVFQVYVIGLYLPERKAAAADAINAPGPKRVAIHMLRDVDATEFAGALTDGMRQNLSESEMKGFEPRLQRLVAVMNEMKVARKGMRVTLDWAGAGTQVTVDGKPSGAPIEGEDFYRALLKIWIGEHPVQDDLKQALLGARP